MENFKIVPNIWFTADGGSISKIIEYYKTIFQENFENQQIIPLGETLGGKTEMCIAYIFGQKYILMSTALEHHPLNDSVSFMINCDDQDEIDKYWNYFTREGEKSQCGWCIDKYGLRWQVLPENLDELMSMPGSVEVMMRQNKIIIKEYFE